MREIKFRAWDGEAVMYDWMMAKYSEIKHIYTFLICTATAREIMQYTGLKDSKGVEIYEGDIVEWVWLNNTIRGTVGWDKDRAMFFAGDRRENMLSCVEVIGNIYESPELLK